MQPHSPGTLKRAAFAKERFPEHQVRRSALKSWKSFQAHRCCRLAGTSVGQPQAGAAAHACTEFAARNATAKPSGSVVTPSALPAFFEDRSRCPHNTRRCGEAARRNRGARGELFPPHLPFPFPPPEYRNLLSAPDTLYWLRSLHDARCAYGGSEFRLLAAVGRASDAARDPGALKSG